MPRGMTFTRGMRRLPDFLKISRRDSVVGAFIFLFGVLGLTPAQAGLGEGEDSVQKDGSVLYTQKQSFAVSRASGQRDPSVETVQVTHLEVQGVQVREYSASGIIFAVTWSGVMQPDLQLLLGRFNDDMQRALIQTPRLPHQRRAFAQLKGDRLWVEKWGHLGSMRGRAYVPDLMPDGIRPEALE
jgi:hypothetical protein